MQKIRTKETTPCLPLFPEGSRSAAHTGDCLCSWWHIWPKDCCGPPTLQFACLAPQSTNIKSEITKVDESKFPQSKRNELFVLLDFKGLHSLWEQCGALNLAIRHMVRLSQMHTLNSLFFSAKGSRHHGTKMASQDRYIYNCCKTTKLWPHHQRRENWSQIHILFMLYASCYNR